MFAIRSFGRPVWGKRTAMFARSLLRAAGVGKANGNYCRSLYSATIWMRSAELTGAGESVQVRREGNNIPSLLRAAGVSIVKDMIRSAEVFSSTGQHLQSRHGEGLPGSALSEESRDARPVPGLGRASIRLGSRAGAAEERRQSEKRREIISLRSFGGADTASSHEETEGEAHWDGRRGLLLVEEGHCGRRGRDDVA